MSKFTLITGGVRSGKSHFAQELALKMGEPVLFVATATAGDEEMRQRIEKHQKSRPATWITLEATTHIGSQILSKIGNSPTVMVDCITLLVNNIFLPYSDPTGEQIDAPRVEKEVMSEIDELVHCIDQANASFIMVTNEVGLGLVPANKMSRLYRDLLGKANQILAQRADEIYLLVAGIPIMIKSTRTP
ncbi:bifunctional adenosylcobinamide kinase/adenosylcobinamide-phosphate guanylyltransferase [Chloroflexota bacterium]